MRAFLSRAAVAAALASSLLFVGCSGTHPSGAPEEAQDASVAPKPTANESVPARLFADRLRDRFRTAVSAPLEWPEQALKPPERAPYLLPSAALDYERDGDRLVPRIDATLRAGVRRPVTVRLPGSADQAVEVKDDASRLSISVTLEDARNVPAEIARGYAIYRGGHGSGADVIRRVTPEGAEDYLHFESDPGTPEIRYEVALDPSVAGLRVLSNVVEFLDASGAPRLRMAPPSYADASGDRHPATATVEGCAVDTDPRGPWGRPVTPPGARRCTVRITWETHAQYPVLLDPSWTSTGNLVFRRTNAAMVVLSDGRALVAGDGSFPTGSPSNTRMAELYLGGAWTPTGSTLALHGNPFTSPSMFVMGSGNPIIIGGANGTAEIYSLPTGTWNPTPGTFAAAQGDYAAELGGDRYLVVPGFASTVQISGPGGGGWSPGPALSAVRAYGTATRLPNGSVLIVGGRDGGSVVSQSCDLYDAVLGTMVPGPLMSSPRKHHSANLVGNFVVAVGGQMTTTGGPPYLGSTGNPIPAADRYDLLTGTWSQAGFMAVPRAYHAATTLFNGTMVVAGGYNNPPFSELYDPVQNVWGPASTGTDAPPLMGMVAATLQDGTALFAGGTPQVTAPGSTTSYLYDSRLPQGALCAVSSDCSGGACVDGFCCNAKCNGVCQACASALTGQADGTCAPAFLGKDPHNDCNDQGAASCGTTGLCDGAGACQRYAPGTVCRLAANECDVSETCVAGNTACPTDVVQPGSTPCTDDGNVCTTDKCNGSTTAPLCAHAAGNAGTQCRAAAGVCDIAETCTGTATACPLDQKQALGYVCRAGTGPCDVTETCNGASALCPTDALAVAGASCPDDGNLCTTDKCDGSTVNCQHAAGNAGTVCRPSVGACDADDVCTGSSASCPADGKLSASTPCRPSAGTCDITDNCDGTHDNCPADQLQPSSYQCRGPSCASGVATLATNCTGSSTSCPAVTTVSCSGTCVGSSCGICVLDTDCLPVGTSYCAGGTCNSKKLPGVGCGAAHECTSNFCADGVCCNTACAAGTCDACNLAGSLGTCSAVAAATVCRLAAGECDAPETCGGAMTCPADQKVANGTACTDDGNPCTTDKCNGSATTCLHAAGNSGSLCRPANGTACDVADYCDGASTACADGKQPSSYTCRAATGECDVSESCSGTADACPTDVKIADGTVCTDDGNVCTTDKCQAGTCAHAAGNAGTQCRAGAGVCDLADTCTGTSTTCLDAKLPAGFSCRVAAGVCDQPEVCDGTTNGCPADVRVAAGTVCADDGNPCTVDKCDGTSSACGHIPGNANVVCRYAAGPCDVDDKCDGASATCVDGKQPATFVCRYSADVCDVDDKCDGAGNACPTDVFKVATTACRPAACAAGTATLPANCTGSGPSCPPVLTQPCPGSPGVCSGAVCANGCSATNPCPSSQYCAGGVCVAKTPIGQACGAAAECTSGFCADGVCCNTACNAGPCDSCTIGTAGTCSAMPSATVCRAASSECDVDETCGGSLTCPPDVTKNGSPCSSDGNVCTTDACSGAVCAHVPAPTSTVCRAGAGECDVAETCGGGVTCPVDTFKNDGASCSSDGSPCSDDVCQSGSCAHVPAHAGMICRSAASECDAAESCNGVTANCPADGPLGDGTACTGDGNVCTLDECRSGQCAHPAGNAKAVCRDSVGECDLDEKCDGKSTLCPSDAFVTDGTACTVDTSDCTRDVCGGGVCTHPAGNSGVVCRTAVTDCDADEKCNGVATACPPDDAKPDGATCAEDGNLCTKDTCLAGACNHPNSDGASCSDGNTCTSGDQCAAGQCVGAPVQGCTCTKDSDCSDGNVCNGVETCVSGTCKVDAPLDCDDQNDCTVDGCKPVGGCSHTALADGATCNDGAYCTVDDQCLLGTCRPGSPRDCSGVASGDCESGVCDDTQAKCNVQTSTKACDDGNSCTIQDTCTAGSCQGQAKLGCRPCAVAADCEDQNPCTKDFCDDLSRECFYVKYPGCVFNVPTPDAGAGAGGAAGAGGGSSGASGQGGASNAGGSGGTTSAGGGGAALGGDAASPVDGGASGGGPGAGGSKGAGGATGGTASADAGAREGGAGRPTALAPDGGPVFKLPQYGSCTCRLSEDRRTSSGGASAWASLGLVAFVLGRRRARGARGEGRVR